MANRDASIELVKSNTLQPMNMIFSDNIITDSIAYIFVNTECKGHPYDKPIEKGAVSLKLWNDVLGFKKVNYFTDLPKSEILRELKRLKEYANDFEERLIDRRKDYEENAHKIQSLVEEVFEEVVKKENEELKGTAWKQATLNFEMAWDVTNELTKRENKAKRA